MIDVPILFLHAEDDWVVPYRQYDFPLKTVYIYNLRQWKKSNVRLGRTLYEAAIEHRPTSWPEVRIFCLSNQTYRKVEWRGFSGSRGYAHNHICRAPELPEILRSTNSIMKVAFVPSQTYCCRLILLVCSYE